MRRANDRNTCLTRCSASVSLLTSAMAGWSKRQWAKAFASSSHRLRDLARSANWSPAFLLHPQPASSTGSSAITATSIAFSATPASLRKWPARPRWSWGSVPSAGCSRKARASRATTTSASGSATSSSRETSDFGDMPRFPRRRSASRSATLVELFPLHQQSSSMRLVNGPDGLMRLEYRIEAREILERRQDAELTLGSSPTSFANASAPAGRRRKCISSIRSPKAGASTSGRSRRRASSRSRPMR